MPDVALVLCVLLAAFTPIDPAQEDPQPAALPESVDLRPCFDAWKLAPRLQGDRGTCSVFVVTGALEFALARQQALRTRLSVEFLNWASNDATGVQHDGSFFSDLWKGFEAHGICDEEDMPYRPAFNPRAVPPDAAKEKARARKDRGLRFHWIKEWDPKRGLSASELEEVRKTLARGWPVCGGFLWPKQQIWDDDVLRICPREDVRDGHSVLLVGYRDDASRPGGGLFIIRNSSRGGRDGYLTYEYLRAYMNDAAWIEGPVREDSPAPEESTAREKPPAPEASPAREESPAREKPPPPSIPSASASALVEPVSAAVRERFKLSEFYRKQISLKGFPILGSEKVSDFALLEAHYIISSMLRGRDDIVEGLIANGIRCAVMAPTELTTDIPEHSDLRPDSYWNRRARGLGPTRARPCVSCAEENLLQYRGDPYSTENILVHEFAHTIHESLKSVDRGFDSRLRSIYEKAMEEGLWKGTYAGSNREEYWAEGVQSYFGTNRENDHDHNHVNTRQELKEYDPRLAGLLDEVFRSNPWQYVPPRQREEKAHLEGCDPDAAPPFAWPQSVRDPETRRGRASRSRRPDPVEKDIEGWTVLVDPRLLEGPEAALGEKALRALGCQLFRIALLADEERLAKLRQLEIWIELENPRLRSMQYHPSADWLRGNGHDERLAKKVHIPRAESLLSRHETAKHPWTVLHELAHAYEDRFLGWEDERLKAAFEKAREDGKYESVLDIFGRRGRHYALSNHHEYFAEGTEAYFYRNDFYPFVRSELKEHDPTLYDFLREVWGPIP